MYVKGVDAIVSGEGWASKFCTKSPTPGRRQADALGGWGGLARRKNLSLTRVANGGLTKDYEVWFRVRIFVLSHDKSAAYGRSSINRDATEDLNALRKLR